MSTALLSAALLSVSTLYAATPVFAGFYLWTCFGLEVLSQLKSTVCPLQNLAVELLHKEPWDSASSPFKFKNSMFAPSSSKSLHGSYLPLILSLRGNHIPPSYSGAGKHLSPCPDSLPKWSSVALRIACAAAWAPADPLPYASSHGECWQWSSNFSGVDTFTESGTNVLVNEHMLHIVGWCVRTHTHGGILSSWAMRSSAVDNPTACCCCLCWALINQRDVLSHVWYFRSRTRISEEKKKNTRWGSRVAK